MPESSRGSAWLSADEGMVAGRPQQQPGECSELRSEQNY